MAKLWQKVKVKKVSTKNWNRFYTRLDMAIIKHDVMVKNSQIKRSEVKQDTGLIYVCTCGTEGCFIHS